MKTIDKAYELQGIKEITLHKHSKGNYEIVAYSDKRMHWLGRIEQKVGFLEIKLYDKAVDLIQE